MNPKNYPHNPVLPPPWVSNAPVGYGKHPKRLCLINVKSDEHLFSTPKIEPQPKPPSHFKRFSKSETLRNLNISTLLLSFPEIPREEIDEVLKQFNFDLSLTIGFLCARNRIMDEPNLSTLLRSKKVAPATLAEEPKQSNENLRYIPTKYKDVEIVEENHKTSQEMHITTDIVKMPKTANFTARTTGLSMPIISLEPYTSYSEGSEHSDSLSSLSPFTPTVQNISSEFNQIKKDQANVMNLPEPNQKNNDKVGIKIKKGKDGFSVNLL